MRSTNIIDLAQNPNLIPGIHNYCDRWCERCPYTSRCLVYATEEAESDGDPASRDINNAAFWQKLSAIFRETHEMISTWAKENGVDLSPEALAAVGAQSEKRQEEATNHPLAVKAEHYARQVRGWFEHKAQPLEMVSDGRDELEEPSDEHDHSEVIHWYQFLIAVKLIRGLQSRIDEDEYLEEGEPRDSDGSVKVALIGIDRSLAAWKLMSESRIDEAASIHEILMDLEKLRLLAEKEFPSARDFIRPGFDENLDNLH